MVGTRISHYEILERLGEGGMGVVYKARDSNLDRFVALKVLSPHQDDSPETAERFEQEAKTISALNHPHIATIHGRGEVEGKPYLVFEFLAGGTLRQKVLQQREKGESLPLEEVLRYAIEAAAALAYAHRRGVVHRDIKTDNLMLTDGDSVKITDFGLAKWRQSARITGHGQALGTAAYMSPEQTQGLDIDQRSDVFSFGLVLYELAAGEAAYKELYPAAVLYDIVNTPTPSLNRPDAPEELDRIIQKATAKDPNERYQQMNDLLADLRILRGDSASSGPVSVARALPRRPTRHAWLSFVALVAILAAAAAYWLWDWDGARTGRPADRTASRQAEPISIAVLPLENLSGDPAQDYLADGMTEALITNLAKIPSLRVISRTSVMQYRRQRKPLREIAQELNVVRVVEGTVLKVGDEIRITAQLIDGRSDEHLWADSYQRSLTDVLSLQQEVARSIATEVKAQLTARDQQRLRQARTINPEAYEAYLRGKHYADRWNPEDVEKSVASYQKAIEIDPNYASAYAGLAASYGFQALFGGAAPAEAWPAARAAADRALQIDQTLENAHTALGFVQAAYDWNWLGAERAFQRALELNPNYSTAYHAYAMTCLAPRGRLDEAMEAIQRARELDPLSLPINVHLGDIYAFRREYGKAIAQYERVIELDPGFGEAYQSLAFTHIARGKAAEAANVLRQARGGLRGELFLEVWIGALSGDREEAIRALRAIEEEQSRRYICACRFGVGYLMLGDKEKALESLERAYRERSGNLLLIKVNPLFDAIRSDPRFQSLLRRMNLNT